MQLRDECTGLVQYLNLARHGLSITCSIFLSLCIFDITSVVLCLLYIFWNSLFPLPLVPFCKWVCLQMHRHIRIYLREFIVSRTGRQITFFYFCING